MKGLFRTASGRWGVRFKVDGRDKRVVVSPDRKVAVAYFHKAKAQIAESRYIDVKKTPNAFFDNLLSVWLKWSAANKRTHSQDVYTAKRLKVFFGSRTCNNITVRMVEDYKAMRTKQVSKRSVDVDLIILKAIFNKGIIWGMIADNHNPVRKVKMFREPNVRTRFLSQEEISRLLAACNPLLRLIVLTALYTGFRKSEILHLRWKDIDFKQERINKTDVKNGEQHAVPMHPALKRELLKLPRPMDSETFLFTYEDGRRVVDPRGSFKKACEKAEIKDCVFHSLRHTFASHLVMGGESIMVVKELLGHKSLSMTARYSHLADSHKREAMERLYSNKVAEKVADW